MDLAKLLVGSFPDLVVTKTNNMIKIKTACWMFVLLFMLSFAPNAKQNGLTPPDKAYNELKGKLKTNQGHLVLLNFWASHHAGSRIENIKFAQLAKHFQHEIFPEAKGFVVVSVSLDAYPSIYEETVKRDGLTYTQNMHASNGLHSKLAKTYKLGNDFGNLLLDAEGKVLARNLSAENIKEILKKQQIN